MVSTHPYSSDADAKYWSQFSADGQSNRSRTKEISRKMLSICIDATDIGCTRVCRSEQCNFVFGATLYAIIIIMWMCHTGAVWSVHRMLVFVFDCVVRIQVPTWACHWFRFISSKRQYVKYDNTFDNLRATLKSTGNVSPFVSFAFFEKGNHSAERWRRETQYIKKKLNRRRNRWLQFYFATHS